MFGLSRATSSLAPVHGSAGGSTAATARARGVGATAVREGRFRVRYKVRWDARALGARDALAPRERAAPVARRRADDEHEHEQERRDGDETYSGRLL